jgi:hypothetical protein
VEASFTEQVDPGFFSQPGDIADLSLIDSLSTSPTNLNAETWGLVVFNSQANLPTEVLASLSRIAGVSGVGVVYLALGGVTVSDATPIENLIIPLQDGIPMTTLATADLRQAPIEEDGGLNNVVGRIPGEATVNADAITSDGDWIRVVYEGNTGWIRSSVLPSTSDLSSLVEIGPDNFTAMQSINLELNGDNGECVDTYAGLIIQGPNEFAVDVVVNGVTIQVTSSVLALPLPNNILRIPVYSSAVTLFPHDPNRRTIIPAGFMADVNTVTGQLVTKNPFPGTHITPFAPDSLLNFLNHLSRFKPTNIFHYRPGSVIINHASSGGGRPEIIITLPPGPGRDHVEHLCEIGVIPEHVCQVFNF